MKPQSLILFSIVLSMSVRAAAVDPVSNLSVLSVPDESTTVPSSDWWYYPTELNLRTGSEDDYGPYTFVGLQRGGSWITHIDFEAYPEAQDELPGNRDGWSWFLVEDDCPINVENCPVNINENDADDDAGTNDFVYMFWKKVAGDDPIYNIRFVVTGLNSPPTLAHYTPINVDLNPGNSPNVFAYYSTDPSTIAAIPKLQTVVSKSKKENCCGNSKQ